MKHLATIQIEFLKEARKWEELSLDEQKGYLQRHPKSKRKLTAQSEIKTETTPEKTEILKDQLETKRETFNRDKIIKQISPNQKDARSLANVPDEAIKQVYDSINDSLLPYGKYGQTMVKGVQTDLIGEKFDEDTFADYAPYKRKIVLNSDWFSKKNYNQMLDDIKQDVAEGYSPVGCESVKAIIDHEIAHGLYENLYGKNPFKKQIDQYLTTLQHNDVLKNLSEYATESKTETVAEAWTEYKNNKSPRLIAKTIGDLLDKAAKWQGQL